MLDIAMGIVLGFWGVVLTPIVLGVIAIVIALLVYVILNFVVWVRGL